MPQLILEYSANVFEKNNSPELFKKLHLLLTEMLPTQLASCKSRAIEYNTYCVGDGNVDNAFVHINLKVLSGRSVDTLQNTGNKIIEILKNHFSESMQKLNLQMSVEISELAKTYFKFDVQHRHDVSR